MFNKKKQSVKPTTFNPFQSDLSEQEQFEMAMKLSLEDELKKETISTQNSGNESSQWVTDVKSFSSEYAGWPATNVCGKVKFYPGYGDNKLCWAPATATGTMEFLELSYEKPTLATKIKIYETFNPGSCIKVSGKDSKGNWVVLWEGAKQKNSSVSVINELPLKKVDFSVSEIRLDLDCVSNNSWYEIDAVELIGQIEKQTKHIETSVSFATWYMNPLLSDFTFILEEEKFPAHKFVLANTSSKLLEICQKQNELKVTYPEDDFITVLKYLYTGRFSLTVKTCSSVLKIADFFNLVELRKSCFDFMVSSLDKQTVIETLLKAQKKEFDFDASDLIGKCIGFIQEHAFEVLQDKTIDLFDTQTMISLVQGDKLTIEEFELFEIVLKWAKKRTSEENLDEFIKPILFHIRWPLMNAETLYHKVKTSRTLGKYMSDDDYLEALEYNLDSTLFDEKNPKFKTRGSVFKGSSILNGILTAHLVKMIPVVNGKTWTLLFKASKDGFANQFHTVCDGKGPTITIVQSTNGNIFGGYNPVSWSCSGSYTMDPKTFIFTLVNLQNIPPTKMALMGGKNGAYNATGYGPTFGGGHDFYICSNGNTSNSNYSNCGNSFQVPSTVKTALQKQSLLAGAYNFQIKDFEVFYMK